MERTALQEIQQVLEEELDGPLAGLTQLLEPVEKDFDLFTQSIKNVKEAWRTLTNGYLYNQLF